MNIESIDFILDAAKKYAFRAFFQPLSRTYFYDDVSPPSLKLTSEELEVAIRKLMHVKRCARPDYIGDSLVVLRHFIHPAAGFKCYAGRLFAYVHCNGDVYPCWTPPKLPVLNCTKVGFKRAFDGIPQFSCNSCLVSSLVKRNYVGSLNREAICNTISSLLSIRDLAKKA